MNSAASQFHSPAPCCANIAMSAPSSIRRRGIRHASAFHLRRHQLRPARLSCAASQHRDEYLQRLRTRASMWRRRKNRASSKSCLPEDTYLRTGRFNKDDMLGLIQTALRDGAALGFPLTRMIAHAETAVDDWKNGNDWVEYEMRLNEVLPNYDDPVICIYDVNL